MKNLLWLIAIAIPLSVSAAEDFDPTTDLLGCGEIVSLKPLNQRPLMTSRLYERGGGSGGTLGQLWGGGVIGLGAALFGELALSVQQNFASKQALDDHIKAAEFKDVYAVKFKFDDGREIYIPMYVMSGMRYKEGVRVKAYMARALDNIQLGYNPVFGTPPLKGEDGYEAHCAMRAEPEFAELLIVKSANLVDESKLVKD